MKSDVLTAAQMRKLAAESRSAASNIRARARAMANTFPAGAGLALVEADRKDAIADDWDTYAAKAQRHERQQTWTDAMHARARRQAEEEMRAHMQSAMDRNAGSHQRTRQQSNWWTSNKS